MIQFVGSIALLLTTVAWTQLSISQTTDKTGLPNAGGLDAPRKLPPSPTGRSTVMGGSIRNLDPVRDQFTLHVFGGQSMKILFDSRTEIYRDGERIKAADLHDDDHASVETTLDGTKIFALRIHISSQLAEGVYRGLVSHYDPQTGLLTVNVTSSQQTITLRVPPDTPIVRVGQEASSAQRKGGGLSDLSQGSLLDVKFRGGNGGHGIATHIDVLATTGSTFVFTGKISFLDLHLGRLTIVSADERNTYEIEFDPSQFPVSREFHDGTPLKVTTRYDGSRYVASEIKIE